MTCPTNSIAGKKHRQLARQVRGVVKINPSTSLMAPFNINIVAFIPGEDFRFGSFHFIAGVDGRLHVSNLEAIRSGQIESDFTDSNANLSEMSTTRIWKDWETALS